MSRKNVEAVQRVLEAFKAGDPMHAWTVTLEVMDPEMKMDMTRVPMLDLARVYSGPEEIADFWVQWLQAWDSLGQLEDTEIRDAGDQVVFWTSRQTMQGKHSGVTVDLPWFAWTMDFQRGKIVRATFFLDKAEALEAAGLSE